MAQNITFNGVVYSIPNVADDSWGESLSNFFIAIPQGALQKSGGTFTLSAEVNFGATYGLLASYFKSRGVNPSTVGLFRLSVADTITWRNNANSADLVLGVNASDQLIFEGSPFYPNGINALTGDVTATGPGSVAATIPAGTIDDARVNVAAAIARSKLASGTNYRILANSSSGVMSENAALTANRVVIVDANGQLADEATLSLTRGGTGAATKTASFDALSPMTTSGDIIYGGASGTGTRLAKGADGTVLTLASGVPSWATAGSLTPTTAKTANYTATSSDEVILVSTNTFAITLPTAVGINGKSYTITKTDNGTSVVSIATTSAETISGIASGVIKLTKSRNTVRVVSNGTNWVLTNSNLSIVSKYYISANRTPGTSQINYDSVIEDTWSLVTTGASWGFTVPIDGLYEITANQLITATQGGSAGVYVNSGINIFMNAFSSLTNTGVAKVRALATQVIDLRPNIGGVTFDSSQGSQYNVITIQRVGD